MQAAAAPSPPPSPLRSLEWRLSEGAQEGAPAMRLEGPEPTLAAFLSLVAACGAVRGDAGRAAAMGRRQLWPIFVLSRGRPETAHLHWGTAHALGVEAGGSALGDASSGVGGATDEADHARPLRHHVMSCSPQMHSLLLMAHPATSV